mmetsp:Transcript_22630/g.57317  ORF Transcript_22630/g.57317 Transcript_22630/m.57317 type:complete len:290 (+) Transcript_22630:939-1808(+)
MKFARCRFNPSPPAFSDTSKIFEPVGLVWKSAMMLLRCWMDCVPVNLAQGISSLFNRNSIRSRKRMNCEKTRALLSSGMELISAIKASIFVDDSKFVMFIRSMNDGFFGFFSVVGFPLFLTAACFPSSSALEPLFPPLFVDDFRPSSLASNSSSEDSSPSATSDSSSSCDSFMIPSSSSPDPPLPPATPKSTVSGWKQAGQPTPPLSISGASSMYSRTQSRQNECPHFAVTSCWHTSWHRQQRFSLAASPDLLDFEGMLACPILPMPWMIKYGWSTACLNRMIRSNTWA